MQVLVVCSRKGGSAKSTCVRSFAVQGLLEGRKTAILDADVQGTTTLWAQRRSYPAPAVETVMANTIKKHLADLERAGAELVVIDTPPSVHPIINSAIEEATACLIVSEALPESLEQVGAMVSITSQAGKPSAILLTRVPSRSSALTMAMSVLTTFQIPVCPIPMTQLIVHSYSNALGQTAQEKEGKGRAAKEIKQIWDWLLERKIV